MRFVIVKMSALGDIVHAFSVLQYLKEQFPGCTVDWVVEKCFASLVAAHPLVDRVVAVDVRGLKKTACVKKLFRRVRGVWRELRLSDYDVLFDLQANTKSALVSLAIRAKKKVGFGFATASEWINPVALDVRLNPPRGLCIQDDYLYIVTEYLKKEAQPLQKVAFRLSEPESERLGQFPPKAWLVCPGSNWPNKKLAMPILKAFLAKISDRYSPNFVFLCGSSEEKKEAELLAGQFQGIVLERPTFGLLQHCMNKAELVLSMDSMPLHLAATTTCATFSVFGPSSASKYAPCGPQHGHVQGSCPYGEQFDKRCRKLRTCSTGLCMQAIDPDALFEAFARFWALRVGQG